MLSHRIFYCSRIFPGLALTALLGLPYSAPAIAQDEEATLEAVAAAVRDQGQSCAGPESVKLDPDNSSPDEKAWIIACETARYRVKFLGDRGAEVTQLE